MLTFMRAFAKSKVALVLFFLLVVGLAITGGNAFFGGAPASGAFVQAGKYSATQPYFDVELDGLRGRLGEQQQPPREITREQAAAEPFLVAEVKKSLVNRVLLLAYGDQIGFRLAPDAAVNTLAGMPGFQDGIGRLDRAKVAERAQQMKFGREDAFYEYVREDVTVSAMQRAAISGIRPPQILTRQFTDYLAEQRNIAIARIEPKNMPVVADPTEAVLRAHYEANKADYSVGETRAFDVIQYSPMDFVGAVAVADDKIKAEYDRRITEFSTPQTREVAWMSGPNFNAVQAAVDLIKQGRPIADAVNASPGVTLETRSVQPGFSENKALDARVFQMQRDEILGPFQLEEGQGPFIAFRINSITPGTPFPLDEPLKGQIAVDLAFNEARRTYDGLSESVTDMVSGGVPLDQIAAAVRAPIISLPPFASTGRTPEGHPALLLVPYLREKPEYMNVPAMQAAFAMQPGAAPLLVETAFCPPPSPADRESCRSRMIIQLASVTPAFTRPFEDVRAAVLADWRADQQLELIKKTVEGVVAKVKAGQTLEAAAKAANMAYMPFPQPLDRNNAGGFLGEVGMEAVFALPKDGVTSVTIQQSPDPIVVQVLDVQRIDPAQNPQLMAAAQNEVRQTLTRDMMAGLLASAAAKVKVTENTPTVDAYIQRLTGQDQQLPPQ